MKFQAIVTKKEPNVTKTAKAGGKYKCFVLTYKCKDKIIPKIIHNERLKRKPELVEQLKPIQVGDRVEIVLDDTKFKNVESVLPAPKDTPKAVQAFQSQGGDVTFNIALGRAMNLAVEYKVDIAKLGETAAAIFRQEEIAKQLILNPTKDVKKQKVSDEINFDEEAVLPEDEDLNDLFDEDIFND